MTTSSADSIAQFNRRFVTMRGDPERPADLAVSIPVNAKADLSNVLALLGDIAGYAGKHTLEVILVINNFTPGEPPDYIPALEAQGLRVVAVPSVKRPGMAIPITARMIGVDASTTDPVVSFDADCRIPYPTDLIDWYVAQFQQGADLAYTYVGHYNILPGLSVKARLATHHLSRWFKRAILGIPATRGSNFAVRRSFTMPLYEQGYMADDINVGPVIKKHKGKVAYANKRRLHVLTSARFLRENWGQLIRYLWYRLRYNIRTIPVSQDAAKRTKRR